MKLAQIKNLNYSGWVAAGLSGNIDNLNLDLSIIKYDSVEVEQNIIYSRWEAGLSGNKDHLNLNGKCMAQNIWFTILSFQNVVKK